MANSTDKVAAPTTRGQVLTVVAAALALFVIEQLALAWLQTFSG